MGLMTSKSARPVDLHGLKVALADLDPVLGASEMLQRLVGRGFDKLPRPGSGATLERWRVLAMVARHDLSLAKLYEGHTDALAILDECGAPSTSTDKVWGVWAAEAPAGKVWIHLPDDAGAPTLHGAKSWCSGALTATHGLLTAWVEGESMPRLMSVGLDQPGVHIDVASWHAVGMAGSASVDIRFDGVRAESVGTPGQYLMRPGFWQGGAGVAACWFGGSQALGDALHRAPRKQGDVLRAAACGKVDLELRSTAALLREVAAWIDAFPRADSRAHALRARLAAERCAHVVLDETGRTLGAAPFCRDARFARMAADLPVFIRQSHAERDFAALGQVVLDAPSDSWAL